MNEGYPCDLVITKDFYNSINDVYKHFKRGELYKGQYYYKAPSMVYDVKDILGIIILDILIYF